MNTRSDSESERAIAIESSERPPRGARGAAGSLRSRRHAARPPATRRRKLATTGLVIVLIAAGIVAAGKLGDRLLEVTLPLRHDDIIRQQAREKGVPADLIAAVIFVESRFRDQTSSAGARGLMQITPSTADEIEKLSGGQTFTYGDLADPNVNIRYGTFYLAHLRRRFDGNLIAAIAAYNAGPSAVEGWGGSSLETEDVAFEETRDYVRDVLDKRVQYRDNYRAELGLDPLRPE